MTSDTLSPRAAAMVGALAFVPVAWYGIASSGTAAAVSAVNVLIILASMAMLTGEAEGSEGHGTASA
ncbi:cytochrome-ba3 oxidase subunit [Natronomonas sp. F2-12]|jgi:hypothetical protein|uniref:Cytochrome-ba3 oxidase subunit n=1 Tax=Natronomonas aquatica TaxID=2841590 RepID=A0A9R1CT15_9EURY|nr:cytochrome-ba3 oxidase subunit [Natronomonas aquatica]MCQ4333405.1 cytochrome-ba3 oxidase subunit [Natronomonas aquatica]